MNDKLSHVCNWCNQPSVIIWVHGHAQCTLCGLNFDECCRREEAHPPTHNLEQVEKEKSKND